MHMVVLAVRIWVDGDMSPTCADYRTATSDFEKQNFSKTEAEIGNIQVGLFF